MLWEDNELMDKLINLGGGLRIKVPFVNEEIFKLMNICDICQNVGEIYYNLIWNGKQVICRGCDRRIKWN